MMCLNIAVMAIFNRQNIMSSMIVGAKQIEELKACTIREGWQPAKF